MKSLTTLAMAIALAFAFSTPAVFAPTSAQALEMGMTFENWGREINEWWDDGGKMNRLLGDLEHIEEVE